jgi:hypothetical protein
LILHPHPCFTGKEFLDFLWHRTPRHVNPHTIINTITLRLVRGDITLQDTDTIVNAANSCLMGGGRRRRNALRRGTIA